MKFSYKNVLLALAVGVGGAVLICGLLAFAAHAEAATPRKIAPPRPAVGARTADVAGRDLAVSV
jgi:hypothetical protein